MYEVDEEIECDSFEDCMKKMGELRSEGIMTDFYYEPYDEGTYYLVVTEIRENQ